MRMKRVFLRGEPGEFEAYLEALTACGLEPVRSMELRLAADCDGLLLPGGADVDPGYYGQENQGSIGIDLGKDEDELTLARQFIRAGKPVLGICRGCQVLNIALGGTLHQDILGHSRVEGEERFHPVQVEHPMLRALYGERFTTNSSHHQSIDRLGEGLTVLCRADDGVIEGVLHQSGKILGTQFHPERMCFRNRRPEADDGAPIFRFFAALLEESGKENGCAGGCGDV